MVEGRCGWVGWDRRHDSREALGLERTKKGVTCFGNLYTGAEQEENVVGGLGSIEGFPVSAISNGDELKGGLEAMRPSQSGEWVNDER